MGKKLERHGRLVVLLGDAAAISMAYFLAFYLRFDFSLPSEQAYNFLLTLPLIILLRIATFYYFGLYNGIWRYASMADLTAIFKGILTSQVFVMAAVLFVMHAHFPRSVLIISPFIAFIFIGGIRFAIRATRHVPRKLQIMPYNRARFSLFFQPQKHPLKPAISPFQPEKGC